MLKLLRLALFAALLSSSVFAAPPQGLPQRSENGSIELAKQLTADADARLGAGDWQGAHTLYFRAFEQFALREASLGLALTYARLGKYDHAIAVCDDMIQMQSGSAFAGECSLMKLELAELKASPVNLAPCKSAPQPCRAQAEALLKGTEKELPRARPALALFLAACDAGDAASCGGAVLLQKQGLSVFQRPADQFASRVKVARRACELKVTHGCVTVANLLAFNVADSSEALEQEGLTMLTQRCEQDPTTCSALGVLFNANGLRSIKRDAARATQLLAKACEAGGMYGCTQLGRRFTTDKEALDLKKGWGLYEKACLGGDTMGCSNLGFVYHQGREGQPKDPELAKKFFTLGCDGGDPKSCSMLGVMLAKGIGTTADLPRALAITERACAQGLGSACTDLGNTYRQGTNAPKDPKRAAEFFKKSCALKEWDACAIYASMEDPATTGLESSHKYQNYSLMACDAGALATCANFADWLVRGGANEFDGRHKVASLYRKACDGGLASQCSWALRKEMGDDPKREVTGVPAMQAICDKGEDKFACSWLEDWRRAHPTAVPIASRADFDAKRRAGDVSGLNLNNYALEKQNLEALVMKKTTLVGASLAGARLAKANLTGAKLNNADLRGADLSGADLTEADLSGANLEGAVLKGTVLKTTNLSKAKLQKVDLREAKLADAWFIETDLRGADLSGRKFGPESTTWDGVRLDGANLSGTTFWTSSLGKCDLRNVDLKTTKFSSATFSELHLTREQASSEGFVGNTASQVFIYAEVCAGSTETWRMRFKATSVTQYANGSRCN